MLEFAKLAGVILRENIGASEIMVTCYEDRSTQRITKNGSYLRSRFFFHLQ